MPLDLFWSYRVAKCEVASENRLGGPLSFAHYEQNLARRLGALEARGVAPDRLFRNVNPGKVWVRPKAVDRTRQGSDSFLSVPERPADHQIKAISVRVVLEPSPDFATSEVLWLRAFGASLETLLTPHCRGNRLDLRGHPPSILDGAKRIFRYWNVDFRRFRKDALAAARRILRDTRERCLLTTLDLASYYDNIQPSFLVSDTFIEAVKATATRSGLTFDTSAYLASTTGLLEAFSRYWHDVKQLVGVSASQGIPIGALTSRLIANLALTELDRLVVLHPSIKHYARYVDDILVVESTRSGEPGTIRQALARLLPFDPTRTNNEQLTLDEVRLRRPGSKFTIQLAKLRAFDLYGEQGLEYLGAIETDMERLSSERRRFLEPWRDELDQTVAASPNQEPIRALREADVLTLRRYAVATTCEKVTTAAAMLNRAEAARFSRAHLGKAGRLATDWSRWVDLLDVSLRILGAALISSDGETANELVDRILLRADDLANEDGGALRVRWGASSIRRRRARRLLGRWVEAQVMAVISSATPFDSNGFTVEVTQFNRFQKSLLRDAKYLSAADLRIVDRETDVAVGTTPMARRTPLLQELRSRLLEDGEYSRRLSGIESFLEACNETRDPVYADLEPLDVLLLYHPPTYSDIQFRWLEANRPLLALLDVVNSVRGTFYFSLPLSVSDDTIIAEQPPWLDPESTGVGRVQIILGNLCTDGSWWNLSLTNPALTVERQARLARVINQALDAARRAHRVGVPSLLVLPELSLPRRWRREVFRHLMRADSPPLSLVAGLEYQVSGGVAYNEAVAFLPRPFSSSVAWIWTKRRPAFQEDSLLQGEGFTFATRATDRRFVIIRSEHGAFLALICSELLEVDTRSMLLGKVDLVLVPSWNRDTTSFEYMMHSSALELHSFIAVANNGIYSDCRARGPYYEPWQREVCRLITRGENEVVVADLPIHLLREYRDDPRAYEQRRNAWLQEARKNNVSPALCPWPAWKPVPPGMPRL